jgi:serine protease Do
VQTDASINPGSSGGALVDMSGKLVGINTLIFSQAGGNEGLGFAAPSNIVRTVYEQIRKTGRVRRGDIGVRPQTITPVLASGLALARDRGVVVADVLPGSPAARAGVLPGDLILALDGKPMENGRQLQIGLYRRFVGDMVTLDIVREGRRANVPVTVAEREDAFADAATPADQRDRVVPQLGILGVNLDQRIAEMLPVLRVRAGVVVVSSAERAIDPRDGGLSQGDVIFAVNRSSVGNLGELRAALAAVKSGDAVVLQLERRGALMYLAFTME